MCTTTKGEPQAAVQATQDPVKTQEEDPQVALDAQREAKKVLVIGTVADLCKDSEFPDMKAIGDALKAGDELVAKIIAGGETNFSFKVYLKNDHSKALFAKLSFNFALWNPDKSVNYDLQRCQAEFDSMKSFSKLMGGPGVAPVVEPYHLVDIVDDKGDSKLLVAQWASADVQFSRQFTDGKVDTRVLTKLAESFAVLNSQPVEDSWNESCRSCFGSLHPVFKAITTQFASLPADQSDECVALIQELGLEYCLGIIDAMDKEYMETREVLNHNDTKQWNILVEAVKEDGSFGKEGKFTVCDWEMTIKGKSGKDVGVFIAFIPAAAFGHAVQGHKEEAHHLIDTIFIFWKAYVDALKATSPEKDDAFLRSTFLGALGGFYLYLTWAYYAFGMHADALPLEGVAESDIIKAKGAMGFVGLKAGEIAYAGKHKEMDLPDLEILFQKMLRDKVDELLMSVAHDAIKPRRSSIMVQHQRQSDTFIDAVSRRKSQVQEEDGAPKRASVYDTAARPAPLIDDYDSDDSDDE